MSYHTMYPILVHKNLSVMAGFEPASDTSKPKEGSRSRRSTTREGHEITPISLPWFQKPTKPFNQNGWSVTWPFKKHEQLITINQENWSQCQNKKTMQEIKIRMNIYGDGVNHKKVMLKYGKMFCFAPASVESIPDRWNFVNFYVHVLSCTISDSSI